MLSKKKLQNMKLLLLKQVASEKSNLDDPVLFCDGCFAMFSAIKKSLSVRSGQTLKARIENSLGSVCTTRSGYLKDPGLSNWHIVIVTPPDLHP